MDVLSVYLEMLDNLLEDLLNAYRVDLKKDFLIILSDHGSGISSLYPNTSYRLNYLFKELGWLEWQYGRDSSWDPNETAIFSGNSTLADGCFIAPIEENSDIRDFSRFGLPSDSIQRKKSVIEILKQLKTVDGRPLFNEVVPAERSIKSNQNHSIPLAFVSFNREINDRDHVIYQKKDIYLAPYVYFNKSVSAHNNQGVFILAGPGIDSGKFNFEIGVEDVTPTALMLLGLPLAADFDGRAFEELSKTIQNRGYQWIESYDPLIKRSVKKNNVNSIDKEYLEKLKSLGYLK